jgi:hypothetical protein
MQPQVHLFKRMRDDSGNMSIDFLAGFTIFLMAFIWVATMIPGMLIGLQAYTIDYDAVAYRTGVLLVEDPGYPEFPGWETLSDQRKVDMIRFGLASSKQTPNILDDNKINRFFNKSTFTYPDDYQKRVIFGDFPYHFNISLRDIELGETRVVGEVLPSNYGYIRRLVKIKSMSNASIDASNINAYHYKSTDDSTTHIFSIQVNNSKLLARQDTMYRINPGTDQIMVNISDLRSTLPPAGPSHIDPSLVNITLTEIEVFKDDLGLLSKMGTFDEPYIDDNSTYQQPPYEVRDKVTIKITPDNLNIAAMMVQYTSLYINLTFNLQDGTGGFPGPAYGSPFLNNTHPGATPFDYNYNMSRVTQPKFRDAIVEVAVW